MVVFVDTSAIYALANAADPNHGRSVEALRSALEAGEELLTHNYVVVESAALLHRRLGWIAVSRFVREASAFRIRWVDDILHRAAAERFSKRRGQVSLVDEVSFLVMREAGIQHALAFDQDFRAQGFHPYPG